VKYHASYDLWKREKGTAPHTVFDFEIQHKIHEKLTLLDQKKLASMRVGKKLAKIEEEPRRDNSPRNFDDFKTYQNQRPEIYSKVKRRNYSMSSDQNSWVVDSLNVQQQQRNNFTVLIRERIVFQGTLKLI